uniref:NADH-ubiquinone oxidoreductase chain 3 n=1 Tax=Pectinaria gouldii TaxID=260746 RepID=G8XXJ7_PECGU|nr:NADH dehydrogenase subunit 3 [Pectinaria gouldii]
MLLYATTASVSILLPIIVFFLAWSLSLRSTADREKSSPFECGFDPKNSARLPFSLRFFLLAVIFLVFDIEIALLMPIPFIFFSFQTLNMLIGGLIFLIILMVGLLHEWREGSLDWTS